MKRLLANVAIDFVLFLAAYVIFWFSYFYNSAEYASPSPFERSVAMLLCLIFVNQIRTRASS